MKAMRDKLGVVQNMGLADRALHCVLGASLLGASAVHLVIFDGIFGWWDGIAILISIYPTLTGILGWDPFYAATGYKTCGLSEKNPCGTLPYQVDAALGHHPVPDKDYDHSLAGSHHEHPHHEHR